MASNRIFATLLAGAVAASLTVFAACDDDGSPAVSSTPPAPVSTSTVAPTPAAGSLQAILAEAIDEEYKARATYQAVLEKFGQQAPFTNIVKAEDAHVQQWATLLQKLGFAVPADPYATRITAPATVQAACVAGVAAEKEDVALYQRLIPLTANPEALAVMEQQTQVSRDNHLPAFERCAG